MLYKQQMKSKGKRLNKSMAVLLSISTALSLGWTLPGAAVSAQTDGDQFTGASIVAFPGAEGGGAYTSGGRGGDVYIVTSLKDYGENEEPIEGSLRYGVTSTPKEGRTIVFHVSGTIELKGSLRFSGIKNLTIAGQTAPGNGITIAGWDTNISDSENIIIRYLTFRPGAKNVFNGSDSMDALWGRDNNYFILDHCSFSWNTDETLSTYRGENGTIQWSLISESLTLSGHSKGRHGYGGIAGGDNTTFHHNLYVSHTSRNPRLGGGYAGAADAEHVAVLQFSNNVVYNWGFNGVYGGGYTFTNFMNNVGIAGPGTRDNVENRVIDAGESGKLGGFYISGNRINGKGTGLLDGSSEYVKNSGDSSGDKMTTYATKPYLSADSTGVNKGITNKAFDDYVQNGVKEANEQLLTDILEQAGATYPRRDAIDARIVAEVEQGLGRYINTEHEVGGYVSEFGVIEEQRAADFDTNRNGMADTWEKEKGIWEAKDAYKTITDSGYTWLEQYINGLVDMEHAAENPEAKLAAPANNAQYALGEAVSVEVQASSDFGHNIAKVAVYNGSKYLGDAVAKGSKYVYTIEGLEDASHYISARVTDSEGNATQTTAAHIHINSDGGALAKQGWTSADIGKPDVQGTASITDQVLTVKGNGKLGMSEGSTEKSKEADAAKDDFHFVYKEVTGDMEITAKLEEIGSADNHAFTGVMVRDDLKDDSATAALGLSWVKISNAYPWSAYLAGRETAGGDFDKLTETLDSATAAEKAGFQLLPDIAFKMNGVEQGYWLKLGRKGDTFYAYGSADGKEWTPIGEKTVAMKDSVYVGFAVDSNDVANDLEQLNYAKFSNIRVKDHFKPISEEVEMGPLVTVDGLQEVDPANLLDVSHANNKMVLTQSAAEGRMTKSTANLASNVSYLVFPKSNRNASMEMDVTITSKTTNSNDMGLFVGAFQVGDSQELFSSLGFRSGNSQTLTGIWSKLGKENSAAGNGSSAANNGSKNTKPSYVLNETYHVVFEKNDDGYVVHYKGVDENGEAIDATKLFKATEAVLSSPDYLDQDVQLGFALTGVTAEIENLVLKDEFGRVMYSQKERGGNAASPADQAAANGTSGGTAPNAQQPQQNESTQNPSKDQAAQTEPTIYVVQKGDSLSAIAKKFYGSANMYPVIFEANKEVIANPHLIFIGQKLVIPNR
ncbi:LysM peptidoglycan-binding domain-containing protein [Paenibacillus turpanensis]|uniref:LysM peptidoglycan-binding domain-containing protein n=1 Tax=Paenibacillus turpanensis TaxID=2689078 RepID=UPI001A9E0213|nr:LysM peptidoglycan-binding domain-containing protein [Paenibacillus turpanensis]